MYHCIRMQRKMEINNINKIFEIMSFELLEKDWECIQEFNIKGFIKKTRWLNNKINIIIFVSAKTKVRGIIISYRPIKYMYNCINCESVEKAKEICERYTLTKDNFKKFIKLMKEVNNEN